jgi:dGTPase
VILAHELAPYAASEENSRGRAFEEPAPKYRGEYQRDRDRIIHSTAFRRLLYKTQVFVNYEGDMYRTRLTHSLEVAQIARTVARALHLNEDLAEAICLAHDLGHTPFGHAGQDALNECMRDYGGFEHNLQSLRVVDELEWRYASFAGLNLCFETREGILKHCSLTNARHLGELGRRFIERTQPSLEAQLANVADEIAYNNHDVDDGLRAGLITLDQLAEIPFFAETLHYVQRRYGALEQRLLCHEVVREMIDRLVTDLLSSSRNAIDAVGPQSIDDVRRNPAPMIHFDDAHAVGQDELKRFLRKHLYMHPRVGEMTEQAHATIRLLFAVFMADHSAMPQRHAERATRAAKRGEAAAARVVADYIAGMTDRFALGLCEQFRH